MPRSGRVGDVALYRRVLEQARPYRLHFALLFGLGLLASPIALLTPVPLRIVVDSVIGGRPVPPLVRRFPPAAAVATPGAVLVVALGLLVLVAALNQAQQLAGTLLRTWVGERLALDIRSRIVDHVQRLSLIYHDSRGTPDSLYRIQYDAPAIQNILVDGAIPFITAAMTLTTMIVVTARLDWPLALVALGVCPVLLVLSRAYRGRMRRQSRHVKKLEASALAVAHETLGALRVVKAFGQEARETARFVGRSREGMMARLRLALMEGRFGVLVGLTTAAGTAAVLFIGVQHVRAGTLTLGQLLMVLGYLGQLYDPLKTISRKAAGIQSYLASAERVFALLDEPFDVPERAAARPLTRARGAVTFRDVSFAYDGEREEAVLRDVSFDLRAGARVAVAGATGAGKSTLLNLLTRFYDPTAGAILLDGIDLRDYRVADLRNQFAIVLQEPLLFSTTIGENIAYGRPGASAAEIARAAAAAGAHDFIVRLPRGYETPVGERGLQLSGGERQRVALARAFLKDAALLILDEPTSSVDAKTESAILDAMDRLMEGRTAFLITHRERALAGCDARLQLERGRLLAAATPLACPTPRTGPSPPRLRR